MIIKSKTYNFLLIVLGTLAILPFLAPIFMHLGWEAPAKVIYLVYSFFCHQFSSRSILIFDYQIAWCARDTAIWIGIFISFLLIKFGKLPRLKWYYVIPFVIPMAMDGGIQTLFTTFNVSTSGELTGQVMYISNNLSRFMTGAIFGIGVGWWLGWQFAGSVGRETQLIAEKVKKFSFVKHSWKDKVIRTVGLIFLMFTIYIGIIFIWKITSPLNPPTDALDFTVKTPQSGFFDRRGFGVCPTSGVNDLLNFDCFFGQ